MTIAEMPGQGLAPGQGRVCGRLFAGGLRIPFVGSRRRGRRETLIRGQTEERKPATQIRPEFASSAVTDSLPSQVVERRTASSNRTNAPLESLSGDMLTARFHAWRGGSGRRYICSVFPVKPDEFDAGLPDFGGAVVIAVARNGDGRRRLVAIFQSEIGANAYARESFVIEALAEGAGEWHVHLLATQAAQRRVAIADIEAMRYGAAGSHNFFRARASCGA